MNWNDLENAFQRALFSTLSKRKFWTAFPVLLACGVVALFCKALAYEASPWVRLSLAFLPILLGSGVLLTLGVLLIRMHATPSESLKKQLWGSLDLLIGTSYLSIPSLFLYLLMWLLLGCFLLLRQVPILGPAFGVLFAFGPFLLITSSLLLCVFNAALLFFVSPLLAREMRVELALGERILRLLRGQLLSSTSLFLLGLLPTGLVVLLLTFAAHLTQLHFVLAGEVLSATLGWFFLMVPYAALLTPSVLFFFHFAAESSQLLCKSPSVAVASRASLSRTTSSETPASR